MKRYKSRNDFRKTITGLISKKGFQQDLLDEYHIEVLEGYRIAAAYCIPVLTLMITASNGSFLSEIIKECRGILTKGKIFMLSASSNLKASRALERAVKEADKCIVMAGNVCNNGLCQAPDYLKELLMEARDVCDAATKRKRYS